MEKEIKPGDVVQLETGGVWMTVESLDKFTGGVKARCTWMTVDGEKRSEWIAPAALVKRPKG